MRFDRFQVGGSEVAGIPHIRQPFSAPDPQPPAARTANPAVDRAPEQSTT
jgi:hypothetical protein